MALASNIMIVHTWLVIAAVTFCFAVFLLLIRMNMQLLKTLRSRSSFASFVSVKASRSVSVIIPAKDEAATIEKAVQSIRQSRGVKPEIILVNDRSVDDTFKRMYKIAFNNPRARIVNIAEKPPGWTGKTYAMWRGAALAEGAILVFTDADVVWAEDTLFRTLSFFEHHVLDVLSILPGFTERGFLENCAHLHLALGFAHLNSLDEVNYHGTRAGVASGCFIMLTREAYNSLGGWSAFRREISEDVALSRAVKRRGMNYHLIQDSRLVQTRPFRTLAEVTGFWTRTFYGAPERRIPTLVKGLFTYATLVTVSIILLSATGAIITGAVNTLMVLLFTVAFLANAACVLPSCVLLAHEKSDWLWGLSAPIGVLIGFYVTIRTLLIVLTRGGIRWRGSLYK